MALSTKGLPVIILIGEFFLRAGMKKLDKFFKKEISKFDIFFDIGANSGTLSLPFIFEDKLDIICFEPLTYNYDKLRKTLKLITLQVDTNYLKLGSQMRKGWSKIYLPKLTKMLGLLNR